MRPHDIITGVISTTAKGIGFIDDPKDPRAESVFIEAGKLNCALHGDVVEAAVRESTIRGKKEKVGEVIRVKERAKSAFVGTVAFEAGRAIVIPDDRKMYVRIALAGNQATRLRADEKVYVELEAWTNPSVLPTGKLVKVLGMKGDNDVEMESIVLDKGFAIGFPHDVEREAREIGMNGKAPSADEIAKRRDMRDTLTFTIDPFDAKDFDDAISFRALPSTGGERLYEIGVHIADVSHYVREGTALDREALKRGCSVYLVDRTIPMLPEVLSNDVCSLNPREDKLSFSAVFVMDGHAKVRERWFGKTVMNSTHRFTYETAQAAIDGDPAAVTAYSNGFQAPASAEPGMKYAEELRTLNRLAKLLQKDKFFQGAIEFEQDEVKFRLDERGKPIGVYVKERFDAHKLVEEYMLLANREVAKFIFDSIKKKGGRDTGSIYRIHDVPDKDKMRELSAFVKALGYELRTAADGTVTAKSINHLLDQIEGTPHESLIRTATIRSMQKAVYSTKNIGHFGLAFDFYTHFTSPIRRYPDLLVHRVLEKHLNGEPFGDRDIVTFQRIAEVSTDREIDAAEAERSSRKLKQVEYMSDKVGKTFDGTISGVAKWGVYVEESESRSEGMISFDNLGNDYWVYDEKTYTIRGERTKKRYTLGDPIRFTVAGADVDKKVLDYKIA